LKESDDSSAITDHNVTPILLKCSMCANDFEFVRIICYFLHEVEAMNFFCAKLRLFAYLA